MPDFAIVENARRLGARVESADLDDLAPRCRGRPWSCVAYDGLDRVIHEKASPRRMQSVLAIDEPSFSNTNLPRQHSSRL